MYRTMAKARNVLREVTSELLKARVCPHLDMFWNPDSTEYSPRNRS